MNLKKIQKFDLSTCNGKNYFGNDSKNSLVFEASLQYIRLNYDDDYSAPSNSVLSWESKQVFKEIIKPPRSNKNILSTIVGDIATKEKVKFNGDCLIQDQIRYTPKTIVKIYMK